MQDLCIIIPTVNRKDLLMNALKIYSQLFPNITKLIFSYIHHLLSNINKVGLITKARAKATRFESG